MKITNKISYQKVKNFISQFKIIRFMSSELNPVWQHNISKKISFLTKDVFRLHADSLDHRDETLDLTDDYERELQEIRDASQANLALAQKDADNRHPVIENIVKREFDTKFNSIRVEFEKACKKVEDESNKVISFATDKLNQIKARVAELQKVANQNSANFQSANEELDKILQETLMKIDEKYNRQVQKKVNEANNKYKAAIAAGNKQEEELKAKFAAEMADLEKKLELSKKSAIEHLNKMQAEYASSIKKLESDKQSLTTLIDNLKKENINQTNQAKQILETAEMMQKNILEKKQAELESTQSQLAQSQKKHQADVAKLKADIEQENQKYAEELQRLRDKLEKEKQRYAAVIAEFENESMKSSSASDQRNQQLLSEQRAKLAALDAQHAAKVEEAKQHELQMHNELIQMQKDHYNNLHQIHQEMVNELTKSRSAIEELKKKHNENLQQIREKEDQELAQIQNKMKTNSEEAQVAISQLMKDATQIKEEMDRARSDQEKKFNEIERQASRDFLQMKKTHEEAIAALNREFDISSRQFDISHNALVEFTKRQYILDSKTVDEEAELSLTLQMESAKKDLEIRRSQKLEEMKENWSNEINEIQKQIDQKNEEKKEIENSLKLEQVEKQKQINEMKKEMQEMETDWVGKKAELQKEWADKFKNLTDQFREEERENEEARRMPIEKFNARLQQLKDEFTAAEQEKNEKLEEIRKERNAIAKKHEEELKKLRETADSLRKEQEPTIKKIQSEIEKAESEAAKKKEAALTNSESKLNEKQSELKKLIEEGKKQFADLQLEFFNIKQNHQKEILELQSSIKQCELDSQHRISEYRLQKEKEFSELENAQKHEIELLNIELLKIQQETDTIKSSSREELKKISDKHEKRLEAQKNDFEAQKSKAVDNNSKILNEKEILIQKLTDSIKEIEAAYSNRNARFEDQEHIARYEEMIQDRKSTISRLVNDFQTFESELAIHENLFRKVFAIDASAISSGNVSATISSSNSAGQLAPISDRRLKKEASLKSVGSAHKIPTLVAPVAIARNKSPQ